MQATAMPNRTAITVRLISLSKEKPASATGAGSVRMALRGHVPRGARYSLHSLTRCSVMRRYLNQEESMAKGQAKSNKEVRKPKKDKAAPAAAPATLGAKPVESSKQKKP